MSSSAKERHTRQIAFLEDENDKIKKSMVDVKERYYEEKKKWQAKYREATKTAANLSMSFSSPPTTTEMIEKNSFSLDGNTEEKKWTARLETLEKDAKRRADEACELAAENAGLKRKLVERRASGLCRQWMAVSLLRNILLMAMSNIAQNHENCVEDVGT